MNRTRLARNLRFAAVPLVLAGLAACAQPFRADVKRFEAALPVPQGQTFAVVADDPALAGGLEFAQYARFVADEMARLGYRQAEPENAQLLVRFDYDIEDGRTIVRQTGFADPFYDPWIGYRPFYAGRGFYGRGFYGRGFGGRGFGGRSWGYGFHDPFFFGGGSFGPRIRSHTVYPSEITLKIDEAATGQRLFEGEAEAISRSDNLSYLVPNLVDAMFTGFPGNSGETVRISIAPEDQVVRRERD